MNSVFGHLQHMRFLGPSRISLRTKDNLYIFKANKLSVNLHLP